MKILVKHNIIKLHQRKWKRNLWSWSLGNMNLVSTQHILHIYFNLLNKTILKQHKPCGQHILFPSLNKLFCCIVLTLIAPKEFNSKILLSFMF